MFTSRAEFRTLLRQDNADLRLTEKSYQLGLASEERMRLLQKKKDAVDSVKQSLDNIMLEPEETEAYLKSVYSSPLSRKQKASQLLLRPDINIMSFIDRIGSLTGAIGHYEEEILEQAEIQLKYDTYIEKEIQLAEKMSQLEDLVIPEHFNYERVMSLSAEARQKLTKIRPQTLGQASRISGVNPSDVQILMVFMGR
jgi:tRNA uridine 5-carboxymethylaminomethyl modification enzyme